MAKKLLTTKKDFEVFKNECELWLPKYALNNWDVICTHKKMPVRNTGECWSDIEGMVARISINTDWTGTAGGITQEEIKNTAHHEVLELLLARICSLFNVERTVPPEEINSERHIVINSIMNSHK